ncbi:MAG: hypothetical protein ABI142_05800, partial [Bryocella sp.]
QFLAMVCKLDAAHRERKPLEKCGKKPLSPDDIAQRGKCSTFAGDRDAALRTATYPASDHLARTVRQEGNQENHAQTKS